MKHLASALMGITLATAAPAQEATIYPFEGSFDDASFALESAIVDKGLVIDYVSHVGEMLERTREDVGGAKIFDAAEVYLFCSAVTSRKVMEADPMNVAFCPYGIFVADRAGKVVIGYRNFPDGPMQEAQALLDGIAREAAAAE